ncbi:MAG: DNA polymerase ligase N-terminal domain-containing protein [Armatimonadota bacterium]|nr:DNA ligase [bacterium]
MSDAGTLDEYREKRDFNSTPEPSPESPGGQPKEEPIFVIQKHSATRLHYDFRLEVDGVLKSWAVPKGPSTNPRDKRLAAPTEDHPLSYANFEGVIPKGHYGAGQVIVWDTGTYRNVTEHDGKPVPMDRALREGHITICLDGHKLKGGYALTRFKTGEDESWLLIKTADQWADAQSDIVRNQPKSAISGRTIEDLSKES